ncbi:MAG TPA: ImmA/IrrE family metallo-endopeptidase [Pyrinomonadaceae bacterium]|jgi:hypothetical protein
MWLDNASQEAINQFWLRCGETEPYPRSLERSISLALPVTLIQLPRLKLYGIESWFARRGTLFSFNCRSRAVRGCLIAYGGQGFIFVDGTDPEDEQRFTIAHEAGHFIADYWLVRQSAISRLGEKILEVFDGLRLPSVSERVHAILAGTSLGVYTELMEREESGALAASEVWDIEDRADRVALALLAPPEDVLSEIDTAGGTFDQRKAALLNKLCTQFGLPVSIADVYASSLLESIGMGPTWVESLRTK